MRGHEATPYGGDRSLSVLVSLPALEAALVLAGLAERGIAAAEAPTNLVVARALAEEPSIVLLDLDAPGAAEAAGRLRSATSSTLVGVRSGPHAMSPAVHSELARPLDLASVIAVVLAARPP